jgi:hypothetical protein
VFARAFEAMSAELHFPWVCVEVEGVGGGTKAARKRDKLKYSCPACSANAWGKPGLNLVCGECEFCMVCDDAAGDSAAEVVELRRAA